MGCRQYKLHKQATVFVKTSTADVSFVYAVSGSKVGIGDQR